MALHRSNSAVGVGRLPSAFYRPTPPPPLPGERVVIRSHATSRLSQMMLSRLVVLILLFGTFTGLYGCMVTLEWIRVLPDRIVVDDAVVASAFTQYWFAACHEVFQNGEPELQIQLLEEQFLPYVEHLDRESALAFFEEFDADIIALEMSDCLKVSAAARKPRSLSPQSTVVPTHPATDNLGVAPE